MAVQQVTVNSEDGATIGATTSDKVSFYGVTPVVQPAGAAQGALVSAVALICGVGFTTSAGFVSFVNQLEEIRASLYDIGILKGAA